MSWLVVEIPVPEMESESVADRLRMMGANGVAEEWRKGQNYVRTFWHDAHREDVALILDHAFMLLVESGILERVPEVSYSTLEEQDWLEGWKQYFSPLVVSERLAVVPSWESFTPAKGQAIITLDPGMAFGTGTHGTTFTCLQALSRYLKPEMSVCDIGSGSGILAIGAVKLGAGQVVATDNDELAIRIARENATVNEVATQITFQVTDLLLNIAGPFELVVANILAPVILQLIPQLPRILATNALFISSGYITSQVEEIRTSLEQAGHTILARYDREDWVTLVSRVSS